MKEPVTARMLKLCKYWNSYNAGTCNWESESGLHWITYWRLVRQLLPSCYHSGVEHASHRWSCLTLIQRKFNDNNQHNDFYPLFAISWTLLLFVEQGLPWYSLSVWCLSLLKLCGWPNQAKHKLNAAKNFLPSFSIKPSNITAMDFGTAPNSLAAKLLEFSGQLRQVMQNWRQSGGVCRNCQNRDQSSIKYPWFHC